MEKMENVHFNQGATIIQGY